eukprot:scaffold1605_cov242-Pinguiococcus_pyrenoidosus.AAC.2
MEPRVDVDATAHARGGRDSALLQRGQESFHPLILSGLPLKASGEVEGDAVHVAEALQVCSSQKTRQGLGLLYAIVLLVYQRPFKGHPSSRDPRVLAAGREKLLQVVSLVDRHHRATLLVRRGMEADCEGDGRHLLRNHILRQPTYPGG